jgi:hypothetical protein
MKGSKKPTFHMPKDALSRINLGQSFAEYDKILTKPGVFVQTPAINAALDATLSRCFFVGRRGTGKTAITYYLTTAKKTAIQLHPQVFTALGVSLNIEDLRDTRQRPFRALVSCFKRALEDEVLSEWVKRNLLKFGDFPKPLNPERNYIEDYDFDLRTIAFVEDIFTALASKNDRNWMRGLNRAKEVAVEMRKLAENEGANWHFLVLIDRIDDSWDGSDKAVIFLMALMHSCVELASDLPCVRPLLFLRENIFERVRQIDNEFARLETCVVSLDWTRELLLEVVERRLQLPLNPKPPLGDTWDYLFEPFDGKSSKEMVFSYCQHRPRDVLTYCSFALEAAQSKKQSIVKIEDLQAARRRFSESRLKDLGDEYSENFPQIQLVLSRFYGLGREFTIPGITAFIQKLLVDEEVKANCATWIYKYTAPHQFIELLYGIGFAGIKEGSTDPEFRSLGAHSAKSPPISHATHLVIHPSYAEALNLQEKVIGSLSKDIVLKQEGMLIDLPDTIDLAEYHSMLNKLLGDLDSTQHGDAHASLFEEIVGGIIKLCFFRVLTNVEPQVRDIDGRVRRDWIASNSANSGFWETVRARYGASQVIWECKNYADLKASDFHQALYYMTPAIGRFTVMCFRGEWKSHYYQHVRRINPDCAPSL